MRPNLFKAVIMDVPFLDVLSSLLDETLPIVQSDYDEWGNPTKVILLDSPCLTKKKLG